MHIFTLAHVLRRPIVVYGVKYVKSFRGEALGYARFEGELPGVPDSKLQRLQYKVSLWSHYILGLTQIVIIGAAVRTFCMSLFSLMLWSQCFLFSSYCVVGGSHWLSAELQNHRPGGQECSVAPFSSKLLVSHGLFSLLGACPSAISNTVSLSVPARNYWLD